MKPPQPCVAVLDDEPQMRRALHRLLSIHGFHVDDYASAPDFLAMPISHPVDCLILDLHMPEISGFDLLADLLASQRNLPVVVITGQDEPETESRVRSLGASAFLRKPVDELALLEAIGTATGFRLNSEPT